MHAKRWGGAQVSEICTTAQIPRRTFYNWRQRYREGGLERLLTDKPKTANTIHRTPQEVVAKVNHLRLETGWCPHRIAGYLRKNNTPICHMTVYRILLREGLNNPLTKPRMKRTYTRWQRRHPNSLWQCDLKVIPAARWLITNLDDHSRFVPASERFNEGTTENVIWLLDRAIHESRNHGRSSPTMGHSSGAYEEANQASTRAARSNTPNASSAASANPPRKVRSNAGSEPTTKNTPDSHCIGNSSNTTITNAHTWH